MKVRAERIVIYKCHLSVSISMCYTIEGGGVLKQRCHACDEMSNQTSTISSFVFSEEGSDFRDAHVPRGLGSSLALPNKSIAHRLNALRKYLTHLLLDGFGNDKSMNNCDARLPCAMNASHGLYLSARIETKSP